MIIVILIYVTEKLQHIMVNHRAFKVVGAFVANLGVAHYVYLLSSNEKAAIVTAGIGCATIFVWQYHTGQREEKKKDDASSDGSIQYIQRARSADEVIFFPDKVTIGEEISSSSREMRGMLYKNILYENAIKEGAGLNKLLSRLKTAEKSIDVCLFNITSEQLTKCVTDTIDKGVKVRLIVDGSTFQSSGTQVKKFLAAGAFVRSSWKPESALDKNSGDTEANGDYLMHHKFAIIDESILITGSFNWTMQALMGNNENIIITTSPDILNPFLEEFESLWKKFDPKS